MLEFLQKCSQELLDDDTITGADGDAVCPAVESNGYHTGVSANESTAESIEYLSVDSNTTLPLSPISCHSDSGYESANSPVILPEDPFEDIMDATTDTQWKQTLEELEDLFPDLI